MKPSVKYILFVLLLIVALPTFSYESISQPVPYGKIKEVEFNWDVLASEDRIGVVVDMDKLKYKKDRPLREFLYKAKRDKDWQTKSLQCFIDEFNEQVSILNFEAYDASIKNESRYLLTIFLQNVDGGGQLKGVFIITDMANDKAIAYIPFHSYDGDKDDEITFRDAMNDVGEALGKIFCRGLKEAKIRILQ